MGNSLSAPDNNDTNTGPGGVKYPLTANSNELQDGHYVCFYSGLDLDQITKICQSMNGVATITDLTIIIAGAKSLKKTISNKYSITSVELAKSETDTTINTDTTNTLLNEYEIELNVNYYMIISSTLLESASNKVIKLRRSIDSDYEALIYIGSSYANYKDSYFDAYITDDFKNMINSSNPINKIKNMHIFTELASIPVIHFNFKTLQMQYNSRYSYGAMVNVTNLDEIMNHINTVRNNPNLMGIYNFKKSDEFIRSAFQKFVYDDNTVEVLEDSTYLFSVGHSTFNREKKTVEFKGRTIILVPKKTADFTINLGRVDSYLTPEKISIGYLHKPRLFPKGPRDNVTQIFTTSQIIQLSRSDFQLYIGYIDTFTEVDIIGTLLNSPTIPTQKFILYCDSNVFGSSYSLPTGLYKTSNNGITNIKDLKNGINISTDYYLTLGVDSSATIENYDIVNIPGPKLNLKTLRNNHLESRQALLTTHTGNMKTTGAYIPDSELIIPVSYSDDSRLVIVTAIDQSPAAIWNMAKNLTFKFHYNRWILCFSTLNNIDIGNSSGFKKVSLDNNMNILYHNDINLQVSTTTSYSVEINTNSGEKIFLFSQKYIPLLDRAKYIGVFSIFPGKVSSSISEYQQYKYSLIQNLSYIDYNIQETQNSFKDSFIGGMTNTLTIYSNMTKFKDPIIDQNRLSSHIMSFDYFPTIQNVNVMKTYLSVFEKFITKGNNITTITYTCLMRVRKEWTTANPPNSKYFEIITGKNPDYVLIFFFGGTEKRFIFDATTRTFSLTNYQSIVLNSEIAQSKTPKDENIYIEDPLDPVIKPSDEIRFVNAPFNSSCVFISQPITTYQQGDCLSFYMTQYSKQNIIFELNGSVVQADSSFTRHTLLIQSWSYSIYTLATFVTKDKRSNSNGVIFLHITTFNTINIFIPSLVVSINNFIKSTDGPFTRYSTIYDGVNKIYMITNMNIIISPDSDYYTFNRGKMYIRSLQFPLKRDIRGDDLILDLLSLSSGSFEYSPDSFIYNNVSLSVRASSSSSPITYPQIDKAANKSDGIRVKSDNLFWTSIRSFIYITNIEKFEIQNLLDMTKNLSVDLDRFFIITLTSYDNTAAETWIYDRLIVVRGNDKTPIAIKYNKDKTYYHVVVNDPNNPRNFMKFGVWTNTQSPSTTNIEDLDFLLNKFITKDYDGTMKFLSNERVELTKDYFVFTLPNYTYNSFPKFVDFITHQNKYILFTNPILKDNINIKCTKGVAVLDIELIKQNDKYSFAEIINFVVQLRALTNDTLHRIIIFTRSSSSFIKRPDKEYKLTIDGLEYNTNDFTFTDNPAVLIYPKVEYNRLYGIYALTDNVFYKNPSNTAPITQNNNNVYYNGPTSNKTNITATIGNESGYKILKNISTQQINMRINIHDLISK